MDKSKTHIAMADCPQIQDGWEPKEGDFVTTPDGVRVIGCDFLYLGKLHTHRQRPVYEFAFIEDVEVAPLSLEVEIPDTVTFKQGRFIVERICGALFLPRQDQYQDMIVGSRGSGFTDYDYVFSSNGVDWFLCVKNFHPRPIKLGPFNSFERLWCAFYMKEAHNKTWDGEKWQR